MSGNGGQEHLNLRHQAVGIILAGKKHEVFKSFGQSTGVYISF